MTLPIFGVNLVEVGVVEDVDFLNVAQAAEMLGIGENAVRERIRQGKLGATKSRKGWRIPASELLEASGLSRGVARYLCQFLAPSLAQNVQEIVQSIVADAIKQRAVELESKVGQLQREIGEKAALLELAREEGEKLRSELANLVGDKAPKEVETVLRNIRWPGLG